jgi:hypothetical protein
MQWGRSVTAGAADAAPVGNLSVLRKSPWSADVFSSQADHPN